MSSSETESEPEIPALSLSTPTAFAQLSVAKHAPGSSEIKTVQWALDTLATLNFRTVRKDDSLHHIIQECATILLDFIDGVLDQHRSSDRDLNFLMVSITSILNPSFLQLLFRYRRLFHLIAMNDVKPGYALPTIICWVDVVLAKLGDLSALLASGFHDCHPDRTLPDVLKGRRQEDTIRAAIQLPDTWDLAPSVLSSGRASSAAKRLTIRLMFGQHVLYSSLSHRTDPRDVPELLLVISEHVQQRAAQLVEAVSATELGFHHFVQQERLTCAMTISLFVVADLVRPEAGAVMPDFRPHTVASVMRLLRFVLYPGEIPTQPNLVYPIENIDAATGVIILWGLVPQWTWTIWLEFPTLYTDVIICLTATYLHHRRLQVPSFPMDFVLTELSVNAIQGAMISVVLELLSRFIDLLSSSPRASRYPTILGGILQEACALVSQWVIADTLGIRNSVDCCKILITLVPYLSLVEQNCHTHDLVIESLALMQDTCLRKSWQATQEDSSLRLPEIMGEASCLAKRCLSSQDDLNWDQVTSVTQLIQFLTIIISKGVKLTSQNETVEFIEAVGGQILKAPPHQLSRHAEMFITCLAIINRHKPGLSFNKCSPASDFEAIWKLGMSGKSTDLVLSAAFSLYIMSKSFVPEPLLFLEAWDHLTDKILLICSQHYVLDDEPLALLFCPTICDALLYLSRHCDSSLASYISTSPRTSALQNILRCLSQCDGVTSRRYFTLLQRRLSVPAFGLLQQLDSAGSNDNGIHRKMTVPDDNPEISHKPIFYRHGGVSRIFFVPDCGFYWTKP